jgi:hypothetical protein
MKSISLYSATCRGLVRPPTLTIGFRHTAFTFGHESQILKSSITGSEVPPGALISFLQKGIQYLQTEAKIHGNGSSKEADTTFDLLNGHLKQKFGKIEENPKKEG